MIEVKVHAFSTNPMTQQPIVWLQSLDHNTVLPIGVGGTEAASIYTELANDPPQRPLTHDLIGAVLEHFDAEVEQMQIVELKDGIFYAQLVFVSRTERWRLDARPSDGIALALKYGAPIYLSEDVLAQGGFAAKQIGREGLFYVERFDPSQKAMGSEKAVETAIEDLLKDTGTEGSDASLDEIADPKERLRVLKRRLAETVKLERYEEAQRIQKEIVRITGEQNENGV